MRYKDKRDNKAYDNFGMREDEVNNLLTYCKSKRKELESNTVDLSIRRDEKMKKKEYGELLKKVVGASLSLAATGGIIAGVVSYRESGKGSGNAVAKNTVELTTEETTELTTEETTELTTEKINNAEKTIISKEDAKQRGYKDLKEWANTILKEEYCKEAYDKNGKLKKGYEEREYKNEKGDSIVIAGKEFFEIDEKDSMSFWETTGRSVYFVCGNDLYAVSVDVILMDGNFVTPGDYSFDVEDSNKDFVYELSNGDIYEWRDDELGYYNQGLIECYSSDFDKVEYDKNRKEILVTHTGEIDYNRNTGWISDGNIAYIDKMGLYDGYKKLETINVYNIVWTDEIPKSDKVNIYYLTDDYKLYEIDGVSIRDEAYFDVGKNYEKKLIAEGVLRFNLGERSVNVQPAEEGYKEVEKPSKGKIKKVSLSEIMR